MVKLSSAKLFASTGCLALSLTAAAGVASADPGSDAVLNTTCSYSQAVAALNDQSPAAAAQFNQSATAQAWLRSFLGSSPDQRQVMLQQAQNIPGASQYMGLVVSMANTCSNY